MFKGKALLQPKPATVIKNPAGLSFLFIPRVPVPCLGSMGMHLPWLTRHPKAPEATADCQKEQRSDVGWQHPSPPELRGTLGIFPSYSLIFFSFSREGKCLYLQRNVTHTGVLGLGHEPPLLLATRSFWPKHMLSYMGVCVCVYLLIPVQYPGISHPKQTAEFLGTLEEPGPMCTMGSVSSCERDIHSVVTDSHFKTPTGLKSLVFQRRVQRI